MIDPNQVALVRAQLAGYVDAFTDTVRGKGYQVTVTWRPHDSNGDLPDVTINLSVPPTVTIR